MKLDLKINAAQNTSTAHRAAGVSSSPGVSDVSNLDHLLTEIDNATRDARHHWQRAIWAGDNAEAARWEAVCNDCLEAHTAAQMAAMVKA